MPKCMQVYKCEDCGALLEAVNCTDCDCTLKCGDTDLELLEAQTADPAGEKHVPVVTKTDNGLKVVVGSVPHPMTEEHYIEFIEVLADDRLYRAYLKPGQAPEAEFCIDAENVKAREHCNVHGLWEA